MKTFLIVTGIILIVLIIFQVYLYFSIKKTEEQAYTTVFKEPGLEVRYYPVATLATIESQAKSYGDLAVPGFRKLAGYIFGGNEKSESIAMTSPVHMDINDTTSRMSFVLPSKYNQTQPPAPNDRSVTLEETPEEYYAVRQFGGFVSDKKLAKQVEKLKKSLEKSQIPYSGNFKYLGYNPPYQLLGRRNEVAVRVEWSKP